MNEITYFAWIKYAIIVTCIVGAITLSINLFFYKSQFIYMVKRFLK